MPLYECVLIARNDLTQQQVDAVADQITANLEADGGSVQKREYWGLRGLAYRIKKNRKGHYVLLGLDAKPAFITEMERQLRLNEDILRFMTVKVDAHEDGPSAMMRKRDDSDREDRMDRGDRPDRGERRGGAGRSGDRGPRRGRDDMGSEGGMI